MMETKTLYGKDKAGKTKVWSVWTEQDNLYIMHGQENGKMQTKCEKIEGKNIDRSNETSPSEQAELEAMSRWRKQIDRGYRESKDELGDIGVSAMLAQDYTKKPHLIKFPCLVSKKIDGCRALAIKKNGKVILQSRGNKEYSIPHIQDALNAILEDGDILDGELYVEGLALQEIMSAVKKPNENTPKIKYLVFDCVSDADFTSREFHTAFLSESFPDCIELVRHYECLDKNMLEQLHSKFISEGWEGTILRNFDGKYESGKRSNDVSKYKTFQDTECLIQDVVEDRNGNGVFVVYDPTCDGTFTCTLGSFDERKYQLAHPEEFIGKWLTVKFQARYLDTGLPQFGTGVAIREGVWQDGVFYPSE